MIELNLFNRLTGKGNSAHSSILDEISARIQTEHGNTFLKIYESIADDKLKLGYDEDVYKWRLDGLSKSVNATNSLVDKYCSLFDGINRSIDVFHHVCNLPLKYSDELRHALKKEYLTWYKIAIPNVPVKIDKLVEVYDFPAKVESAINDIVKFIEEKSFISDVDDFFDESSNTLVISQQYKDDVHEQCAYYVTEKGLMKLFRLHVLCEALNGLSEAPYTFGSLPEIDFKLMDLIMVDGNKKLTVNLKNVSEKIITKNNPFVNLLKG